MADINQIMGSSSVVGVDAPWSSNQQEEEEEEENEIGLKSQWSNNARVQLKRLIIERE